MRSTEHLLLSSIPVKRSGRPYPLKHSGRPSIPIEHGETFHPTQTLGKTCGRDSGRWLGWASLTRWDSPCCSHSPQPMRLGPVPPGPPLLPAPSGATCPLVPAAAAAVSVGRLVPPLSARHRCVWHTSLLGQDLGPPRFRRLPGQQGWHDLLSGSVIRLSWDLGELRETCGLQAGENCPGPTSQVAAGVHGGQRLPVPGVAGTLGSCRAFPNCSGPRDVASLQAGRETGSPHAWST